MISVDDHVIEPAGVWQDRLPEKYREVGPRVVRTKIAEMTFIGGKFDYRAAEEGEDGTYCDWWYYEDLKIPQTRLSAAVGVPAKRSRSARSPTTTCARGASTPSSA